MVPSPDDGRPSSDASAAPGGRFGSPEAVALYRLNAVDAAVADAWM